MLLERFHRHKAPENKSLKYMKSISRQEVKIQRQAKRIKAFFQIKIRIRLWCKDPEFSAPTPTGEQLLLKMH